MHTASSQLTCNTVYELSNFVVEECLQKPNSRIVKLCQSTDLVKSRRTFGKAPLTIIVKKTVVGKKTFLLCRQMNTILGHNEVCVFKVCRWNSTCLRYWLMSPFCTYYPYSLSDI